MRGEEIQILSASFTRPEDTTSYTTGDLVANSTTAGSVIPMSFVVKGVLRGAVKVLRARMRKSGTTITNANYVLHLFSSLPSVTNGDNGAFVPTKAGYVGSLAINAAFACSDGSVGQDAGLTDRQLPHVLPAGDGTFYGLLAANGGYSPASAEVFTVELEVSA